MQAKTSWRGRRPGCLASGLLAALTTCALPAWSANQVLSFSGQVANGSLSQGVSPTTQFDFWGLDLDPFSSFQITEGDVVTATVSLDADYTLPTAIENRFIRLFLNGPDLVSLNPVSTSGGIELFDDGTSVFVSSAQGCGTGGALAACVVMPQPNSSVITFDKVVFNFTIDTLNGTNPVTVETAYFDTVLTTPVPEVQTWALMGLGLAALGTWVRRQRPA